MINVYFLLFLLLIISQAHGTTSWFDHCITTAAGRSLTFNAYITDNGVHVCSDRFLLPVNVLCTIDPKVDCYFKLKQVNLPKWRDACDLDESAYTILYTWKNINNCKQSNCITHCESNYDSLIVRTVAFPVQVAYWTKRSWPPAEIVSHVKFDQWSGDMAVGSCGLVAIHA